MSNPLSYDFGKKYCNYRENENISDNKKSFICIHRYKRIFVIWSKKNTHRIYLEYVEDYVNEFHLGLQKKIIGN